MQVKKDRINGIIGNFPRKPKSDIRKLARCAGFHDIGTPI